MKINRQQAQEIRDNFLVPIWHRIGRIRSACTEGQGILRPNSRNIAEKPKSVSDPTPYRMVYRIEPGDIGWAISKRRQEPLNIQAIESAGVKSLLEAWEALRADARRMMGRLLKYAWRFEKSLRHEFKCQGMERPHQGFVEYAYFQALAVFVVEKQLGPTNEGLRPRNAGSTPEGVEYADLALSQSVGWFGKTADAQARKLYIDKLISDKGGVEELINQRKALAETARKLDGEFQWLMHRLNRAFPPSNQTALDLTETVSATWAAQNGRRSEIRSTEQRGKSVSRGEALRDEEAKEEGLLHGALGTDESTISFGLNLTRPKVKKAGIVVNLTGTGAFNGLHRELGIRQLFFFYLFKKLGKPFKYSGQDYLIFSEVQAIQEMKKWFKKKYLPKWEGESDAAKIQKAWHGFMETMRKVTELADLLTNKIDKKTAGGKVYGIRLRPEQLDLRFDSIASLLRKK